jgi:hypothetical protein
MTSPTLIAESDVNEILVDPVEAVARATTLEELLVALQLDDPDDRVDWTSLPSFGGEDTIRNRSVWSSDPTHLLVGSCADDLAIVSRRRWEKNCECCGDHGVGVCDECSVRGTK